MADNAKPRKQYVPSPIGPVIHPWFNKPDTKFNDDGLYHGKIVTSGPLAEKYAAEYQTMAEEAFAEHIQKLKDAGKLTPAEAKKWSVYVPFEREEDDQGNLTGRIIFEVKQNAKIKLQDGSLKEVKIGLYDSQDNEINVPIYGGSEVRVMWAPRVIPMPGQKRVGVRLDFSQVQVKTLKQSGGNGGSGFGALDDGYVADETSGSGFGGSSAPSGQTSSSDADY